ncbi:MAG TPA: VWA domain-containing protein [Pyrinomonadaceae bacterium]|nr:VWA domain-containing protein [Pyrinomonadaceae bacterium]
MNSFSQTKAPYTALVSVLLILGFFINSFSQTQQREKPKLKDFGSSLKKLKWDPEKNQTIISQQGSRDDEDVITIETSLVTSDVLVTDRQGRPVRDLKATDFAVSEDGVPQQIGHFVLGDNVNLSRSIVLIIDYSRSQFPYIADSIEAAGVLVDQLGPKDRMAIVTDDVDLLVDFTNDKRALKKGLESLLERNRGAKSFLGVGGKRPRFGRSAQFSALMATLNEAFDEEDQNPVIVFQTDGDELEFLRNSIIVHEVPSGLPPEILREVQEEVEQKRRLQRSLVTEFSLDDVYRAAERSRATIYSIIPRTRLLDLTQDEQIKRLAAEDSRSVATWSEASSEKMRNSFKVLEEQRRKRLTPEILQARIDQELKIQHSLVDLAKMSGGWAEFLETKSQTATIYNRILADLNLRYIIGYYPSNKNHDGKKRQITVEVKGHPEYVISSRKSYYAPGR